MDSTHVNVGCFSLHKRLPPLSSCVCKGASFPLGNAAAPLSPFTTRPLFRQVISQRETDSQQLEHRDRLHQQRLRNLLAWYAQWAFCVPRPRAPLYAHDGRRSQTEG